MKPATNKVNPKAVENASLRLGLQDRLREDVRGAQENPDCLKSAKADRFGKTGEPEAAPSIKK
jgi:hypothetical protein